MNIQTHAPGCWLSRSAISVNLMDLFILKARPLPPPCAPVLSPLSHMAISLMWTTLNTITPQHLDEAARGSSLQPISLVVYP